MILFDGDKAGTAATERAMELGLEQGVVLSGARMPENLDPDEVLFDSITGKPLPDGCDRMKGILHSARPLIDAQIEDSVREADRSAEDRAQAIKRVGGWLKKFKDPVEREVRLQMAQKALRIPAHLLFQESQESRQARGQLRKPVRPVASKKGVVATHFGRTNSFDGTRQRGGCSEDRREGQVRNAPRDDFE